MKTMGQIAYEGYLNFSGGRSLISGQPLPKWDEQSGEIKSAWEAAAGAAISHYETSKTKQGESIAI